MGSTISQSVQVARPLQFHVDNQGAMLIVNNKPSKHIDLRLHMIRDYTYQGMIKLNHIKSEYTIADIMTKALGEATHKYFTWMLLQDTK